MQINSVQGESAMPTLVSTANPSKTGLSSTSRLSASANSASSPDASVSLSVVSLNESASARTHVAPFETAGSATVAGKNYPESLAETDGVIVASVPNPPGATATGSSVESAEYNLQVKLDTLA